MAPSSCDAGHLGHEAHTARAVDAARHVGVDQGPEIFVLDRALVVLEAPGVEAVGHGLVLEIAFAALVADRAVERMIDEQELEHALARLLHRLGAGDDGRQRAVERRPEIVDAMAQEATGFGIPATSTRHMRQLPAMDRRS